LIIIFTTTCIIKIDTHTYTHTHTHTHTHTCARARARTHTIRIARLEKPGEVKEIEIGHGNWKKLKENVKQVWNFEICSQFSETAIPNNCYNFLNIII